MGEVGAGDARVCGVVVVTLDRALDAARECEKALDEWWREQPTGTLLSGEQYEMFALARTVRARVEVQLEIERARR